MGHTALVDGPFCLNRVEENFETDVSQGRHRVRRQCPWYEFDHPVFRFPCPFLTFTVLDGYLRLRASRYGAQLGGEQRRCRDFR